MNFFKSVFSDDATPPDSPKSPVSDPPAPNTPTTSWSFGGLIKTLATKSESVIETYRRDLDELRSGLKKETFVIRDVATRSFEAGASVAQESLESVGQAIDDIGTSVWKSTSQIISHGRDSILLTTDHDRLESGYSSNNNDNSCNYYRQQQNLDVKPYSRFDMQVRSLQSDLNTYCLEPEDREEFEKWRSESFVLEERREEIESICSENGVVREIYNAVVPSRVDGEGFWSRYFYRVHKLKQVEEARAKLVKRALSAEEEEDLSWDFDDEDDHKDNKVDGFSSSSSSPKGESSGGCVELEMRKVEERNVVEDKIDDDKLENSEKGDNGESCKDSDLSVVSSQSLPEEDLGWDQIEDIGSDDDTKREAVGSSMNTSRVDIHMQLSSAEEDEDLSWDIEDEDDEPVKVKP